MRTHVNRNEIAAFGGLPPDIAAICHRIIARYDELVPYLCDNPDLSPEIWRTLWGSPRPPADQAKSLVARPLPRELRDIVIRRETRTSVLETFLNHNELELEEQALLAGKPHAGELLLRQSWFDRSLRKPVALTVKGVPLLNDLAYAPTGTYTDQEAENLLLDYGNWIAVNTRGRPMKTRSALLRVLLGRRPNLIDALLGHRAALGSHEGELLTAAAGSANLTADQARTIAKIDGHGLSRLTGNDVQRLGYCLLALMANPRTPVEVAQAVGKLPRFSFDLHAAASRRTTNPVFDGSYATVDDTEILAWLVRRALPASGDYGQRPGRPIELLELLQNPHLDEQQSQRVLAAVHTDVDTQLLDNYREDILAAKPDLELPVTVNVQTRTGAQRTPGHLTTAFEHAVERLGDDPARWETLIGLVDDYEGTFAELVELVEHL